MLKFLIRCPECKTSFWAPGWFEPDTNAAGINDHIPLPDEACDCIRDGGDYQIIDEEYDDPDTD